MRCAAASGKTGRQPPAGFLPGDRRAGQGRRRLAHVVGEGAVVDEGRHLLRTGGQLGPAAVQHGRHGCPAPGRRRQQALIGPPEQGAPGELSGLVPPETAPVVLGQHGAQLLPQRRGGLAQALQLGPFGLRHRPPGRLVPQQGVREVAHLLQELAGGGGNLGGQRQRGEGGHRGRRVPVDVGHVPHVLPLAAGDQPLAQQRLDLLDVVHHVDEAALPLGLQGVGQQPVVLVQTDGPRRPDGDAQDGDEADAQPGDDPWPGCETMHGTAPLTWRRRGCRSA